MNEVWPEQEVALFDCLKISPSWDDAAELAGPHGPDRAAVRSGLIAKARRVAATARH